MTTYVALFLLSVLATLSTWKVTDTLSGLQWSLFWTLLVVIIGLRHDVGGDWFNYIENYRYYEGLSFSDAKILFLLKDPAYDFIYWFSLEYLNGIYATNLICAIIFTTGLVKLCRNLSPMPWLAIAIAMPYIILVVSLGYTRQAAALGFLMYGLVCLVNGENRKFYILLILGSLFHSTLILMTAVGVLYNYRSNIKSNIRLMIFLTLILTLAVIQSAKLDFLVYQYITNTELMSHGAILRILINAIPAFIVIIYRNRFREVFYDTRLWLILSIISIALIPTSFYISTVADRVAIYSTPLQLIILSRLPVLISSLHFRTWFVIVTIVTYLLYMIAWLNLGIHASGWLPYNNLLLL